MTGSDLFDSWKSVREQLQDLVDDLESDPVDLNALRDGVRRLAKLVLMVTKGLEVLGEDYGYTLKMLKEKEGQ